MKIDRPTQQLPTAAYTDRAWFAAEQAGLFGNVWNFVCFARDLAKPGDFRCLNAGPYPLVVLRDRDGGLRAFHNLCRHRGSRLLEGSGNAGQTIRCFYHNWSYDLAGRLIAVPQEAEQFPGLDKSCLGLKPASVGLWRDLIFVHPEPQAEPFETWLAGFGDRVGPHPIEDLVEVSDVRYRVDANWKIVIENFIDGYHFFYLHPVSLGDGDFTKQHWWPAGRHWMFRRPLKPGIRHDNELLPVIDGVDPAYGAGAYVLFPNLALFETATSWSTFHVLPLGPDKSYVDIRLLAAPEAVARLGNQTVARDDLPDCVVSAKGPMSFHRIADKDVHPLQSDNVMLEDIFACEAMQAGMGSPAYEIGALSGFEDALPFFQRHVLDYMPDA
jgi:Rieske 2Fe-2S family protein